MGTDIDTSYDRDSDTTTELHTPRRPKAVGEGKQGKEHVEAHEEPLLGSKSCLQGANQDPEGKVKEGTKASQKA